MKANNNKKRGRSNNAAAASGGGGGEGWSGSDHAMRQEILHKTDKQRQRTALLTHDTYEKRNKLKLKLHITKITREIQQLKDRLENWDPVEEAERERQEQEKERLAAIEEGQPKKKKGRKGPETWQLRGPARPAWQVYDFDTRHVCPHRKALDDDVVKRKRIQNWLAQKNGQLVTAPDAPAVGREYLAKLMQLGHLNAEMKNYKSARAAWIECMELEGNDDSASVVTTAREDLMRLYLQLERYDSASRLAQQLEKDTSTWIRFSAAWVEHHLEKKHDAMVTAIRSNIFCAFLIAFYDVFQNVMEYTEDVHEADDTPQSSLEEALEYWTSDDVMEQWQRNGADVALKNLLLNKELFPNDLGWEKRLYEIEQDFEARQTFDTVKGGDEADDDATEQPDTDEDEGKAEVQPDVKMYAGMFRTAMEMLRESGAF